VIIDENDYLAHYGIIRRSGRYPWGSGNNELTDNQRNKMFLDHLSDLRKQGLTPVEIARGFDISTGDLRKLVTTATNEQRQSRLHEILKLKEKGVSNTEIGRKLGVNESVIRSALSASQREKTNILTTVVEMIRNQFGRSKYVDVGKGVENHIGVSKEKLGAAVSVLEKEGYVIHRPPVRQLGTGKDTRQKILCAPGTTYKELMQNQESVVVPNHYTQDGGRTFFGILPPLKLNPNRVQVVYGDEGGKEADGVIYVRRGVKDLSLGGAHYAQVRIKVGDNHYLKGMAIYKDDLPDGVDIQFNTNKERTNNKFDAMKPLEKDPDNPFGSQISRQISERRSDGSEKLTSVMNLLSEEGDWGEWTKSISSQVLSKQSQSLARTQLNAALTDRQKELDEILSLTNPLVKKKLLQSFADGADSAAIQMKAKALPGQATQVLLPLKTMPPGEVFAPNYNNGDKVVLIRYPHGGTFEIPELIVNNRRQEGRQVIGLDAKDAVGVHPSVAERLSGADFDGDTVLVIPDNQTRVKSTPALAGLRNFDARTMYKAYEGMPRISEKHMQKQMGDVSNLITDMTIRKASESDLARAVRHSMVVIDSYKHHLNYKQSAIDNNIRQLKEKYQTVDGKVGGASTLISRAKSEIRVPERTLRRASEGGPIDKKTGELVYVPTNRSYVDKQGRTQQSTTLSTKLAEVKDAHELSSGTPIERVYADYSNQTRALANKARLAMVNEPPPSKRSQSARQTYAKEVASLEASLDLALRNAPLERQAQRLANVVVKAKRDADPNMEDTMRKKVESQALQEMRNRTGANKKSVSIPISDREWEAIQAGAISNNKLEEILNNTDLDRVRELATPRPKKLMNTSRIQRAQAMLASGATRAEVARQLGVSLTTLDESLK
jgi:DNA-binding CsgD family transcriptional regulator